MNKKMMVIPALLLATGLTLTGCASEPVPAPTQETSEPAPAPIGGDVENPFGDSTAAASEVAERFLQGKLDDKTVTVEMLDTYNNVTEKFPELDKNETNPLEAFKEFNPVINGAGIEINEDQTSAKVPLFLYDETGAEVKGLTAYISVDLVDGEWLVNDIVANQDGEEISYLNAMKTKLAGN